MTISHFIITGTSKGIGEQLAGKLLDRGHFVYGVARGESQTLTAYERYQHYTFDLSQISEIEQLMRKIINEIRMANSDVDMIGLVNNAAMLSPLGPIEQCSAEQINLNIQISLTAPIVLTSCFISLTEDLPERRKIINISSGSGTYPAPGMSVYCSSKAAINMFTRSVGLEQASRQSPVEIIAVDPGMVETGMQSTARGMDEREFAMARFFREAHDTGQLQSADALGEHLLRMIERKFESGMLVKYDEA